MTKLLLKTQEITQSLLQKMTTDKLLVVSVEVVQQEERERPANSEVERLVACTQKARDSIGWRPEFEGHEGLRRGLEYTAEWFQNPSNLSRYKTSAYNL